MSQLSVIIIVKNEADRIRRCLESVCFANEIIILDSGSTDDTQAICRQFTPHVFDTDWPGFGPQKNRALEKATGEWVFSIDADEWVTPELTQAIQAATKDAKADGFYLPRKTYFCGKLIHFGDWRGDKVLRLFKRELGKFTNDAVHECVKVDGKIETLKLPLMHESYLTAEDAIEKMDRYSTLSAKMKFERGKQSSIRKAITHGLWTFFQGYVLRAGFLDGKHGFMLAVMNAECSYYRYIKIWLLAQNQTTSVSATSSDSAHNA